MNQRQGRDRALEQAVANHQARQFAAAESAYRAILRTRPRHLDALSNLGVLFRQTGRPDEARQALEAALAVNQSHMPAWSNLTNVYIDLGQDELAVKAGMKAVALSPADAFANGNLGRALWHVARCDEARQYLERALAADPKQANIWNTLGNVHLRQCRIHESIQCYEKALACDPSFDMALSNILFNMHFSDDFSPEAIALRHREWSTRFEAPLEPKRLGALAMDPARQVLRVGFASPDLGNHAVSAFLRPLVEHWPHDSFELFFYSERKAPDTFTAWYKSQAKGWCDTAGMSDEQLADRIREDGIDILIDLCGHTAGSRLLVMPYRAAPVQAGWLGYFDTTGLKSVDYLIADPVCVEPGEAGRFSETVVRLPVDFVCYQPPDHAPAIGGLPVDHCGSFTFGSQNQLVKLTPRAIRLWARIVAAVPGSRLLVAGKALNDESTRTRFMDDFEAAGLHRDRLLLRGSTDQAGVLARYNEIDLALDPFPCAGGTTTCEALYMGVPVVSLYGDRFAGRHSASHLRAASLGEFVHRDEQAYFECAVRHALEPGRLRELRKILRNQVLVSPLCDGKMFARFFSKALRAMWTHRSGNRIMG